MRFSPVTIIFFQTNENITKCLALWVICDLYTTGRQNGLQTNERIFQNVPLYTNDAAKTLTASVLRRQLNETGSVRQSSQHVNHFNNTNTPTIAFFFFLALYIVRVTVVYSCCCCVHTIKRSTSRLNVHFSFRHKQFSMFWCFRRYVWMNVYAFVSICVQISVFILK